MLTRTSYLVFRSGNHCLSKYLKEGFGHVGVLQSDNFNWIYIDPQNMYLNCTILDFCKTDNVPKVMKNLGYTVLKVETKDLTKYKKERAKFFKLGLHCVTVVKYITGIRGIVWTPYQLFRKLMKMKKKGRYNSDVINVTYIL